MVEIRSTIIIFTRFPVMDEFGPGLAMAPFMSGFIACGGHKNTIGKVDVYFLDVFYR
jgi:hypothetical protein